MATVRLVEGGVTTIERDKYRLVVAAEGGAKLEALSEDFAALLDLQQQLAELGYRIHRIESIGSLLRKGEV